jgi:hypothetical protein
MRDLNQLSRVQTVGPDFGDVRIVAGIFLKQETTEPSNSNSPT